MVQRCHRSLESPLRKVFKLQYLLQIQSYSGSVFSNELSLLVSFKKCVHFIYVVAFFDIEVFVSSFFISLIFIAPAVMSPLSFLI